MLASVRGSERRRRARSRVEGALGAQRRATCAAVYAKESKIVKWMDFSRVGNQQAQCLPAMRAHAHEQRAVEQRDAAACRIKSPAVVLIWSVTQVAIRPGPPSAAASRTEMSRRRRWARRIAQLEAMAPLLPIFGPPILQSRPPFNTAGKPRGWRAHCKPATRSRQACNTNAERASGEPGSKHQPCQTYSFA